MKNEKKEEESITTAKALEASSKEIKNIRKDKKLTARKMLCGSMTIMSTKEKSRSMR